MFVSDSFQPQRPQPKLQDQCSLAFLDDMVAQFDNCLFQVELWDGFCMRCDFFEALGAEQFSKATWFLNGLLRLDDFEATISHSAYGVPIQSFSTHLQALLNETREDPAALFQTAWSFITESRHGLPFVLSMRAAQPNREALDWSCR
jgi:hypothetical protein